MCKNQGEEGELSGFVKKARVAASSAKGLYYRENEK